MQLVCFPYIEIGGTIEVIDCLVLPELPLFVKADVQTFTTVMVNRYLLVLLMLWTKQDARIYHDSLGMRKRIELIGAIKRAAVQKHVQSQREIMEGLLKERQEAEEKGQEAEKKGQEAEEKGQAEKKRQEAEKKRQEGEKRIKEMEKEIEAWKKKEEKEGNPPEKKRKLNLTTRPTL